MCQRPASQAGLTRQHISPVALRLSEKLLDRRAVGSGAGAAAGLIGGRAGTVLSVGAAGLGVILHEAQRQGIETQLRATLNAAVDDMWHSLMDNPKSGALAGIYYLSEQIDSGCLATFSQALSLEKPPRGIALPELPPVPGEMVDGRSPGE